MKRRPVTKKAQKKIRRDYSWLLILVAVFVSYLPALNGGLLWDDLSHITVPELRSLEGLWRIWTEVGATQQYYPMLHSAFWLEHRLWGDSLVGYHLAGVALHSAAAFLLVLILRRLEVRGALFAGLIFALHPVCVESVAWISEQKNTLSAVFYLASAYVYLWFVENARVRLKADATDAFRSAGYWVSFALFVCALLSKTVTASLPAALLLGLWWQRGRLDWRRDALPLVPWFAIAALAGAFTIWFEHDVIGARGSDFTLSFGERLLLAGRVVWFYLAKLFWPHNLTFIYPRWDIDASVWWQYFFPAAVIAVAMGLAMLAKRPSSAHTSQNGSVGKRGPLVGYLYFCGTLVPVLGFVDVFPFLFSYVADHFQYLASLGVIVPVAGGLAIVVERLRMPQRRIAAVSGGALIVALAVMTWTRSGVYRDAETLYRDTIARNPGAWMAYQNLGTELAARNRLGEAIDAYEGALRARPDYPAARRNLVLAHIKRADAIAESPDRADEAIADYEAVLRLEPDHFRAHYNAGTLLMDIPARQPDALRHLESAVTIQPDSVDARVNLGVLLADVPWRSREAIEHLEFALAKRPDLTRLRELIDDVKRRK